jgi:hypothetical protein
MAKLAHYRVPRFWNVQLQKGPHKGQSGFAPDHSAIQGNNGEAQKQGDLADGLTCALYRDDGGGVKQIKNYFSIESQITAELNSGGG